MIDLGLLSARWAENWPDLRPIGHELRHDSTDRWVRLHSLPRSKRYPESDDEMSEVLHRHNTLIAELVGLDGSNGAAGTSIVVVTCSWSDNTVPAPRDAVLARAVPDSRHWQSLPLSDDRGVESWTHLWVSSVPWVPGVLDSLLRLVADDRTAGVMLANDHLEWLYHPYDGGGDLLAPSTTTRDQIAARHRAWLPARPDGL